MFGSSGAGIGSSYTVSICWHREFSQRVGQVLWAARQAHQNYHAGAVSIESLASLRPVLETQLQEILDKSAAGGWPADAQRLAERLKHHWSEWFTFLSHPEVKPDNNDAERALRPIVVHRAREWGCKKRLGR